MLTELEGKPIRGIYKGNSGCSISTSNFQNGSEINAESAFLTINSLFRIELTTVELYIFILYCSFVRLSI